MDAENPESGPPTCKASVSQSPYFVFMPLPDRALVTVLIFASIKDTVRIQYRPPLLLFPGTLTLRHLKHSDSVVVVGPGL